MMRGSQGGRSQWLHRLAWCLLVSHSYMCECDMMRGSSLLCLWFYFSLPLKAFLSFLFSLSVSLLLEETQKLGFWTVKPHQWDRSLTHVSHISHCLILQNFPHKHKIYTYGGREIGGKERKFLSILISKRDPIGFIG